MARGMGGQRRASFHPWRHSRGVDRSRRRLGAGPADRPRRADHRHARRLPKGAAPGDLPIEFPTKIEQCDQSQNRQGARPLGAAGLARPRRRGDRIEGCFAAPANVRFWHKADIALVSMNVRFWGKADIGATLNGRRLNRYDTSCTGSFSYADLALPWVSSVAHRHPLPVHLTATFVRNSKNTTTVVGFPRIRREPDNI